MASDGKPTLIRGCPGSKRLYFRKPRYDHQSVGYCRLGDGLRGPYEILRQPRVLDGVISIATLALRLYHVLNFIPVEGESNCIFYNVFVLFRINNRAQLSMHL